MVTDIPAPDAGNEHLTKPYMWLVIVAGAVVIALSVHRLQTARIDVQFLLLAFATLVFGSRIGVQIPHVKAEITVSDTFVFLILLLYGGEAAVLIAAVEALCSSMRFANKWFTRLFNSALLACSTFVTAWVLHLCFGSIKEMAREAIRETLSSRSS